MPPSLTMRIGLPPLSLEGSGRASGAHDAAQRLWKPSGPVDTSEMQPTAAAADGVEKRTGASRSLRALVATALALATFIGLSGAAGAVPVPWKNCGQAGDIISFSAVDASVWPPQAGKPITILYRGTIAVRINRGAYDVVTVTPTGGRLFRKLRFPPLLNDATAPGPFNKRVTFTVPAYPSGTIIVIHRESYNNNGARLACVDMTVPIK